MRWGILGCARIAERAFIPAVREARGAELHGIAARDEARASAWAAKYGFRRAYRDYAELLDDPAVDAVYVPLPNHLHAEWTIRAARAGKHVLCEKPLALNAGEVRSMFAAARGADVILMEAFMYRFHPQFDKILALIRSGAIGDVRACRASFTFRLAGNPDDYRWRPAMGGGSLYDIGCYPVSAARTVFGLEPVSVFAAARGDPATGIDLAASLLLEFPGRRFAHLDAAFDTAFQSTLEVEGASGRVSCPRAFSAKGFDVEIRVVRGEDSETLLFPAANQSARMVEHFDDAARGIFPLRYGEGDALGNARVIDAALESVATRRPVPVT